MVTDTHVIPPSRHFRQVTKDHVFYSYAIKFNVWPLPSGAKYYWKEWLWKCRECCVEVSTQQAGHYPGGIGGCPDTYSWKELARLVISKLGIK